MRVRSLEASVECGAAKVAHTVCSDITALANVHPCWYHLSVRSLPHWSAPSRASQGTIGRIQVRDVSTDGSSVWTRIVDTRVTDESVLSFTYEHYDAALATFPGYDGYVSTHHGTYPRTQHTYTHNTYTALVSRLCSELVVNPTRVVFLQRFVSEMLNFLSALLAKKDDAPKEPDTMSAAYSESVVSPSLTPCAPHSAARHPAPGPVRARAPVVRVERHAVARRQRRQHTEHLLRKRTSLPRRPHQCTFT